MKNLFPIYSIGHFINQPTNPTNFEVTLFEQMQEPEVDEIHKHTFYEILWIEKGKSKQIIDYCEYEISPGSLFFISPNQLHQFEEWKPILGGSLMFTEDFFLLHHNNKDKLFELSFLDNFYANPCLHFNEQDFAEIKHTIDLILLEHKRIDRNQTITRALLHILLAQVQRCIDRKTTKAISKKYLLIYKRFKHLLDAHFAENKTAPFYADQLHLTPHHLNLITKSVTGKTATQVIRARSMLEAKRLLTFTDYSVSQIASHLHYFDSSYFSKIFKAETRQTPLEFKNQMSVKYPIR